MGADPMVGQGYEAPSAPPECADGIIRKLIKEKVERG